MTYFAYLDEFGHIGPCISRTDPKHKTSPVFGLAGFVLPAVEVRGFGTWFFQHKCELLKFEITAAARSMYGNEPRRHLIEPPFHVESHRYQTLQAADWIAGLVGRLGAIWAAPAAYPENEPFRRYFEHRVNRASHRSGIRTPAAARSTP